jgi:hypothetical protein
MKFQLIIIGAAYGLEKSLVRRTNLPPSGEKVENYNLDGTKSNTNIKFVHGTDARFAFPLFAKTKFKLECFGDLLRDGVVPVGGEQEKGISIWKSGVNLKQLSFVSAESTHLGFAVKYADGVNSLKSGALDTDAYSRELETAISKEVLKTINSPVEWEMSFNKLTLSVAKLREINPSSFEKLYNLHGIALKKYVAKSKIQINKAFQLFNEGLKKSVLLKKILKEWSKQKGDISRLNIVQFLNSNQLTSLISEEWKITTDDFYSKDKINSVNTIWTDRAIFYLSPHLESICNRDYRYCSPFDLMTPEVYTADYETDSWKNLVTKLAIVMTVYPSDSETKQNTILETFELFANFLNPAFKVTKLEKDDIAFMSGPVLRILLGILDGKAEKVSYYEYTLQGPFTLGKDIKHIITNSDVNKERVSKWLKQHGITTVAVYASPDLWKLKDSNIYTSQVPSISVTVFNPLNPGV